MTERSIFVLAVSCLALMGLSVVAQAQGAQGEEDGEEEAVRIRIGTAAPRGTVWHEILLQMQQDWQRIAGDRVDVTIYPSGVQGDEAGMLNRTRVNRLQAVALSGAGLAQVDKSVSALVVPMMLSSNEELDYVWERMKPRLEERLEAEGFIVLNWGDVGWVRFFTKKPARTPDDIRGMKLFTSAGDPETERLYEDLGFDPVPAAITDMVTNLRTGLIDAFAVPPLFAAADQSFALAPYMLDLKFAALVGATLVNQEAWDQIPRDLRPRLLRAAREASDRRRDEIRSKGPEAIKVMQENGLEVTPVDARLEALWQREAEASWGALRGRMVPADMFDEALRLRNAYRRINELTAIPEESDDPEEQRRAYSEVLELDPDREVAAIATAGLVTALMRIADETEDRDQLLAIYTEVLELDSDHEAAAEALAELGGGDDR